MNANQLIRMIMRLFGRKVMNKGIDYAANRGKSPDEMTHEEKQRARSARQTAKKARQSAKLLRRLGKF